MCSPLLQDDAEEVRSSSPIKDRQWEPGLVLWLKLVLYAALISGFCSVKRMRVFDSTTDAGTHLPNLEGWKAELALAEKKVIQRSNHGRARNRTRDMLHKFYFWVTICVILSKELEQTCSCVSPSTCWTRPVTTPSIPRRNMSNSSSYSDSLQ